MTKDQGRSSRASTALTKVAGGAAHAGLDDREKALLVEAQRRGREVLARAENEMAEYGRWIFANIFVDDARAVLDKQAKSAVWSALLAAAESNKLPIGRSTLYNTLRVAAYDKRLADGAWERLTFSHKVMLLPLAEPKALRAAARHVLSASLSVRDTHAYVENTLNEGQPPPKLTPVGARRALTAFSKKLRSAQEVKRFAAQLAKLDDDAREASVHDLEAIVAALGEVLTTLRPKRAK